MLVSKKKGMRREEGKSVHVFVTCTIVSQQPEDRSRQAVANIAPLQLPLLPPRVFPQIYLEHVRGERLESHSVAHRSGYPYPPRATRGYAFLCGRSGCSSSDEKAQRGQGGNQIGTLVHFIVDIDVIIVVIGIDTGRVEKLGALVVTANTTAARGVGKWS